MKTKEESRLHKAIIDGNNDEVISLVRGGVNANFLLTSFTGYTPLVLAAKVDDISLAALRELVTHGAKVNATSKMGDNAMHLASSPDKFYFLLEAGVDPHHRNNMGVSAIDMKENGRFGYSWTGVRAKVKRLQLERERLRIHLHVALDELGNRLEARFSERISAVKEDSREDRGGELASQSAQSGRISPANSCPSVVSSIYPHWARRVADRVSADVGNSTEALGDSVASGENNQPGSLSLRAAEEQAEALRSEASLKGKEAVEAAEAEGRREIAEAEAKAKLAIAAAELKAKRAVAAAEVEARRALAVAELEAKHMVAAAEFQEKMAELEAEEGIRQIDETTFRENILLQPIN